VRALLAVVVAIFVAGCAFELPPTPIVFDNPLPDDPGPDQGGTALQERIFADGTVTAAEYEEAFTAAVECQREDGFDVIGPLEFGDSRAGMAIEPGMDPRLRLSSIVINTEQADGVDRYGSVNARCQAQWLYAVEQEYLRQVAPTEEEMQAWIERAWDCLRANGHPIGDPPTLQDATSSAAYGCEPWIDDEDPET
jgi:hypothetical protein